MTEEVIYDVVSERGKLAAANAQAVWLLVAISRNPAQR
jgi:hypothetical protein